MTYLIIDAAVWDEVPAAYQEATTVMAEADTPEDLATALGINPTLLAATITTYNALASEGVDPEFNKDAHYLVHWPRRHTRPFPSRPTTPAPSRRVVCGSTRTGKFSTPMASQ